MKSGQGPEPEVDGGQEVEVDSKQEVEVDHRQEPDAGLEPDMTRKPTGSFYSWKNTNYDSCFHPAPRPTMREEEQPQSISCSAHSGYRRHRSQALPADAEPATKPYDTSSWRAPTLTTSGEKPGKAAGTGDRDLNTPKTARKAARFVIL